MHHQNLLRSKRSAVICYLTLAAVLSVVAWALRVRRATWRSAWEISATLCLIFQASAFTLTSRVGEPIGSILHDWTGLWNLEDVLGDIFYICAAGAVVHHTLIRLTDSQYAMHLIARRVRLPGAVAAAAMLTSFVQSEGSRFNTPHFMDLRPDGWLTAYWLILGGIVIWLLAYSSYLLIILRTNPKQRRQCNRYLFFSTIGIIATALRMVSACLPDLQPHHADQLVWWGAAVSVIGFAVGFARSWRTQQQWFAPQRDREPA